MSQRVPELERAARLARLQRQMPRSAGRPKFSLLGDEAASKYRSA